MIERRETLSCVDVRTGRIVAFLPLWGKPDWGPRWQIEEIEAESITEKQLEPSPNSSWHLPSPLLWFHTSADNSLYCLNQWLAFPVFLLLAKASILTDTLTSCLKNLSNIQLEREKFLSNIHLFGLWKQNPHLFLWLLEISIISHPRKTGKTHFDLETNKQK